MKQDLDAISRAKVTRALNLFTHIYKKERAIRNNETKLEKFIEDLTFQEAEEYAEQSIQWEKEFGKSYSEWTDL